MLMRNINQSCYSITEGRFLMRTSTRYIFCAVVAVIAVICLSGAANSQQKVLQLSQAASVTQTVGLTDITVTYHRPGVKGREIWGKLEAYDKVWRAGANEATTVNFSDDVTIAGQQLKAGTYSFFITPRQGDWTVIFNSQSKQWGAYSYDSTKDVLKFSMKPEVIPNEEWLSYSFSDLTISSVKLVLRWEKIALPITIETGTDAKIASANNAAVTAAWQQLNSYARYCIDSKTNWDKGMDAVERSIAINENAGNLRTKAELLAQSGKAKEAIAVAENAIKVGKSANPKFSPAALEKLIDDWKKK
jgi:Protein of unknown function (DUF2911)